MVVVSVKASDDNAGLDLATAKVYVDVVATTSGVTCSDSGVISIENAALADGKMMNPHV